jgi:fermentation-respiration switch protein FrsA (DUF1100 family)
VSIRVSIPGPGGDLGATLEVPDGAGPFPGVVLVSGSGPLDRDSNYKRMRFDVSRQLATALLEAGIASARFDKRGVGTREIDWRAAGLVDNADDVAAAVEVLRGRPEVRRDAVLVVGHSEGAVLATVVAARGVPVVGIGLLAGTARSGRDVLRWQAEAIVPTLSAPVRLLLRLLRVSITAQQAKTHTKLAATTTDIARVGGRKVNAKWFREFLEHDTAEDLRRIEVPVLAVTGTKDLQSPPEDVRRIAELAGSRVETHLVPDLTHSLRSQPAAPSLRRYRQELREPVDAEVLRLVVDWATRVTQPMPTADGR